MDTSDRKQREKRSQVQGEIVAIINKWISEYQKVIQDLVIELQKPASKITNRKMNNKEKTDRTKRL